MLTDADMASMRATLNDSLPDLCTIRRIGITNDGAGGVTTSNTDQTNVKCRFSPYQNTAAEDNTADHVATTHMWKVTLTAGTEITSRDRIIWDSRTFEVIGINATRSWEIGVRLTAVEVV